MGIYNFKGRFVPMILSGEKTHTVRAVRRHPDTRGNVLHLYTGLRHKGARLLMHVLCTGVEEITIKRRSRSLDRISDVQITIDGEILTADEREALARRDGFLNLAEMMLFWQEPKNRLPFTGQIIYWTVGSGIEKGQSKIGNRKSAMV